MRYNIFYMVNKGLKALLYETALHLQQADYNNAGELADVLQQVRLVINLFDKHAQSEDTLVFAAMREYEPSVIDAFEKEHAEDHEIGQRIGRLLDQLEHNDPIQQTSLWNSLNKAFIDFLVFNLKHMAHEETVINHLLWRYYTDESLKQLTTQTMANTAPEIMKHYGKWMLRGLNHGEICKWFEQVKQHEPGVVFDSLWQTAADTLPTYRLTRLEATFNEKEQPAFL